MSNVISLHFIMNNFTNIILKSAWTRSSWDFCFSMSNVYYFSKSNVFIYTGSGKNLCKQLIANNGDGAYQSVTYNKGYFWSKSFNTDEET